MSIRTASVGVMALGNVHHNMPKMYVLKEIRLRPPRGQHKPLVLRAWPKGRSFEATPTLS